MAGALCTVLDQEWRTHSTNLHQSSTLPHSYAKHWGYPDEQGETSPLEGFRIQWRIQARINDNQERARGGGRVAFRIATAAP